MFCFNGESLNQMIECFFKYLPNFSINLSFDMIDFCLFSIKFLSKVLIAQNCIKMDLEIFFSVFT